MMNDNDAIAIARECYPELDEMSANQLQVALGKEIADQRMYAEHAQRAYCHMTNDRITKPNTLPSAVIAVADDIASDETLCDRRTLISELREGLDSEAVAEFDRAVGEYDATLLPAEATA